MKIEDFQSLSRLWKKDFEAFSALRISSVKR